MIEIRVTKDLGDYDPKVAGPFNLRQLICLVIGSPICYMIIKYLSPILTIDIAAFFCIIPAGLAYAFGWAKPYGMKMEKFLSSIFITRILAPAIRRYKTENATEHFLEDLKQKELMAELEEKGGKLPKQKKKKYKFSSKAVK